jgi:hypothetical protein
MTTAASRDAGFGFTAVDIKIHCQSSVIQVLNAPLLSAPIDTHVSLANGKTLKIERSGHNDVLDHFRILAKCQDAPDTVWRQFRPYNRSSRRSFPLGRPAGSVKHVYNDPHKIRLAYPALLQSAVPSILTFVEPASGATACRGCTSSRATSSTACSKRTPTRTTATR